AVKPCPKPLPRTQSLTPLLLPSHQRGHAYLDVVRQTARRQGHSERTIAAFVNWVTIFVRFHGRRHPREMQLDDVARFLEELGKTAHAPLIAMEEARIALAFLYHDVLG